MVCLALELVGPWVVLGFSVGMEAFDELLSINVPVLLENLHGVSCSGTCWLLGGSWFKCRYGGFWMSSC